MIWHGQCWCRILWIGFLSVLCALLYLWLIGAPSFLVNRWLASLDTTPFLLGLDRVTFDPTLGVVASGIYLYHMDDYSAPRARVQRVVLVPDWKSLREARPRLRALDVQRGSIDLPGPASSRARIQASQIEGHIELYPDRLEVAPLKMMLFGIQWRATGAVVQAKGGGAGFWKELDSVLSSAAKGPPFVGGVIRELSDLSFQPPPEANLQFRFDPNQPAGWRAQLDMRGSFATVRGGYFDSLQLAARADGYRIQLDRLELGARGNRCHLTGILDWASRQVEARAYSDLSMDPGLAFLPERGRRVIRAIGLDVPGSLRCEFWLGPTALDKAGQSLQGWISAESARLRGIPLTRFYARLNTEDERLQVDDFSVRVGDGPTAGMAEGKLVWDRQRSSLAGDLRLNFDPNLITPVLTSNQTLFVSRFVFTNAPPHFEGAFQFTAGNASPLALTGLLRAADARYRGVAVTGIVTELHFADDVLSLTGLAIGRQEGSVGGNLRLDLRRHLYDIDMAGIMDPHAVGGLVGPGLQKVLSRARSLEAVRMAARGRVDGNGDALTDLQVHVEGKRMGVSNWLTDNVRFDVQALGGRFLATNVTGVAWGGNFWASVVVDPTADGTTHTYQVTATLTNAEFARLVATVRTNGNESSGRVRLSGRWNGPVQDPGFLHMQGRGEVHVEGGAILRQPVLGGLSRLLSVVYPGLGFTSQSDLHADFRVHRGRVSTYKARLEGSLLSMKASGHYAFDGKLRFRVEVQLLRKGPLANVLRFLTMPVTKLLVFQLDGSPQDPEWHLINFSREP